MGDFFRRDFFLGEFFPREPFPRGQYFSVDFSGGTFLGDFLLEPSTSMSEETLEFVKLKYILWIP